MNYITKIKSISCAFAILIIFSTCSFADAILGNIAPFKMDGINLCWAGCCRMVMINYEHLETPYYIVSWANSGSDDGMLDGKDRINYLTRLARPENLVTNLSDRCVDEILNHYLALYPSWKTPIWTNGGNLSKSDIKTEIDASRPIMAGWKWNAGGAHLLVITGYTFLNGAINKIKYNDPRDEIRHEKPFDEFVGSLSQTGADAHIWTESLRMATSPSRPSVGEALSTLYITSGPTQFSYSGSATQYKNGYTCGVNELMCGMGAVTWTLEFYHSTGVYTVYTVSTAGTNPYFGLASTWDVPAFTLPTTGYLWNYTTEGLIPGIVRASAGPEITPDSKVVTYAPQNACPFTVYYTDKSVASTQADVKAHDWITLLRDQLNSGTNISFKAGKTITIGEGVSISNGTIVNFTIDPTLIY